MDYLSDKLDKLSLEDIYEQTEYKIQDPQITIKYGQPNPVMDDYLKKLNFRSWTFISAANPKSVRQSKKINDWNNTNLEIDLARSGCTYTYAVANVVSRNLPSENSFVVFDLPLNNALFLARRYSQNSIVVGRLGGASKLAWT